MTLAHVIIIIVDILLIIYGLISIFSPKTAGVYDLDRD